MPSMFTGVVPGDGARYVTLVGTAHRYGMVKRQVKSEPYPPQDVDRARRPTQKEPVVRE